MTHKFKIGDLVRFKLGEGEQVTVSALVFYNGGFAYELRWPDGYTNSSYREARLELVKASKSKKPRRAFWRVPKGAKNAAK